MTDQGDAHDRQAAQQSAEQERRQRDDEAHRGTAGGAAQGAVPAGESASAVTSDTQVADPTGVAEEGRARASQDDPDDGRDDDR